MPTSNVLTLGTCPFCSGVDTRPTPKFGFHDDGTVEMCYVCGVCDPPEFWVTLSAEMLESLSANLLPPQLVGTEELQELDRILADVRRLHRKLATQRLHLALTISDSWKESWGYG